MQLERLKRHYETAVSNYDEVSLLDLSHVLRIWTELKKSLKDSHPKFSEKKIFKTSTPGRKIIKEARGFEYVFAYMPSPVITYANDGCFLSVPDTNKKEASASVVMKQTPHHFEIRNFSVIFKSFNRSLYAERKQETIKSHNFINWLGAEAVKGAFFNENKEYKEFSISREMIIKRVANTLDGSHASNSEEAVYNNKFDAPVHYLLKYSVGGLPLPYFILMKTAQDILGNSKHLLDF